MTGIRQFPRLKQPQSYSFDTDRTSRNRLISAYWPSASHVNQDACASACSVVFFSCDPLDCSPQAPLSIGFSRQESWSGLPFPPPGDLPDPGVEPTPLVSPALAGSFCHLGSPRMLRQKADIRSVVSNCFNPTNCSLPGSSVHRIFQARILEWVAIPFFRRIFPTQGLNLDSPHFRQILHLLSHRGSTLMFTAALFTAAKSQTRLSC